MKEKTKFLGLLKINMRLEMIFSCSCLIASLKLCKHSSGEFFLKKSDKVILFSSFIWLKKYMAWIFDDKSLTLASSRVCAQWLSCPLCNAVDCSPPGFSVHGIFQARVLEWAAMSFSELPDPEIEPASPTLAGRLFTAESPRKPVSFIVYLTFLQILTSVLSCNNIHLKNHFKYIF